MKTVTYLILVNVILRCSLGENLKLLILHNNDMHSRFEETSRTSGICKDKSNCYGGFARVLHVVRQARKAAADGTGPPVLFLNAGDTYTGTAWFSVHKWKIAADFLNLLHPDVACFGNHEFAYKPSGLAPFLNAINFPIVAANLDFTKEPALSSYGITKSWIFEIEGKRIGVIGYLTPLTTVMSYVGNVKFEDEIPAITLESERLRNASVKTIIALGHSGYKIDKKIAAQVPLVDLVIGGHTNTFLWNGPQIDLEVPQGPYPTLVTQPNGKVVPVLQAYAYTKYMGRLSIIINDKGEIIYFKGAPQLLNSTVPQEEDALTLLKKYRVELDNAETNVVGYSDSVLVGEIKLCRYKECTLANLITDAFVLYYKLHYGLNSIGVISSRTPYHSIIPGENGTITMYDMLNALPYGGNVYSTILTGADIWKSLEIGVRSNGDTTGAEFLHTSGIQYGYNKSESLGSRIKFVKVLCYECENLTYTDIDLTSLYRIVTTEFLINGLDEHSVIKNNGMNTTIANTTEMDLILWYIKKESPLNVKLEERVTILSQ